MIFLTSLWLSLFFLSLFDFVSLSLINSLSVILWVISCLAFIRKNSEFGVISLVILFSFSVTGIVCTYAETGALLSEIHQFAFLTGATSRIMAVCYFVMLSAFYSYKITGSIKFIYGNISHISNEIIIKMLTITVMVLVLLMLYFRIRYGSPNDYGVDRFYYWNNIAPKWGEYAKFILQQLSFLVGVLYAVKRNKFYIFLYFISVLSQYFTGEKFTGLFLSTIFFFVPLVVVRQINLWRILFNPKTIAMMLIGSGLLMITAFLSYLAISGSDASERLLNRFVLQAQMWWAVDYYSSGGFSGLDNILTHMLGFGAENNYQGIKYLMSIVAPADVYNIFMDRGITFTMAGPVNLIYFFGFPLCLLPAIIIGWITGLSFRVVIESIKVGDMILCLLSIKLYYVMIRVLTMADVHQLFEMKTIACIFVFISYCIVSALLVRRKLA